MGKSKSAAGSKPKNGSKSKSGKQYTILTPNRSFNGIRQVGAHSTDFKDGQAIVNKKATAEIFVSNFNYYCPELGYFPPWFKATDVMKYKNGNPVDDGDSDTDGAAEKSEDDGDSGSDGSQE